MSGVSRMTSYIIATRDDVICDASGPTAEGKWMGWITLGPDSRYRPLLNSEATFDTKELAIDAMKKAVAELKTAVAERDQGQAFD